MYLEIKTHEKETKMKKLILLSLTVLSMIISVNAQSLSSLSKSVGLVDQLMQAADVNKEQATAGAGTLFEMAKGSIDAKDFEQIADVVPDMDKMLDAVPSLGENSESLLSTTAHSVMGMPQVISTFEKLGISKEKISLFTPVMVKWVENKGSKHLGNLLKNAF